MMIFYYFQHTKVDIHKIIVNLISRNLHLEIWAERDIFSAGSHLGADLNIKILTLFHLLKCKKK